MNWFAHKENGIEKLALICYLLSYCGRSSIWLEHSPVTGKAAGSSPVDRASEKSPRNRALLYAGLWDGELLYF